MTRCIALRLQPLSTKRLANQSSNSGCVAPPLSFPKSLGVLTMPRPKWPTQRRFIITRAVSGLSALAIHLARAMRRLRVGQRLNGSSRIAAGLSWPVKMPGKPAFTTGPWLSYSPRSLTVVTGTPGSYGGPNEWRSDMATGLSLFRCCFTKRSRFSSR